ncbi:unnamed protein product [Rotaria sordida]|uniref:Uncharacterized protein n=2 Tax=Rotaria sordida TaxID=392033 RepID=A0A815HVW8_9BILA|nr:unnamed protein product [Rotaria sordida]CAF1604755.1 unnamed protein product [Rotaria sordida]
MLPNELFNDPDIFYLYQQFIYKTIIFESVSKVLPDYEEDQSVLKNDGLDYPSLSMKYSCTTNRLTMKIDWVSTSGSFSLATMKVKLHSQPPPTTTYYYWKKNVQEIHKFQQKAKPDENERLSDVLSLIPNQRWTSRDFTPIKIGINGFDLLGQHIFRCALEKGIQVVAING